MAAWSSAWPSSMFPVSYVLGRRADRGLGLRGDPAGHLAGLRVQRAHGRGHLDRRRDPASAVLAWPARVPGDTGPIAPDPGSRPSPPIWWASSPTPSCWPSSKVATGGRWLWLRTIGSTVVGPGSRLRDLHHPGLRRSGAGRCAGRRSWPASGPSRSSTRRRPRRSTYAVVRWLKSREGLDTFDYRTDFNPIACRPDQSPRGRRMEKFRGVDYYGIEELLAEEERMVRDAVRDWVETEFLPIVTEHHRAGHLSRRADPEAGRARRVRGHPARATAAPGLNNVAYGLIMQELERGDSGLRSFASVQSGLVMYPIHAYGSEAQKERWLPRLARGEAIGCFGLTEPDFGSDPGGHEDARATAGATATCCNGTKLWITNGSIADVAVVWAKERRRRDLRLPGRAGHAGLLDARHPRQVLAARLDHLRAAFQDCAISAREHAARRQGAARAASLPDPGALRHRLGRDRRGHGLLRLGAAVRAAAHPVRQAHRRLPARAAEAREDDHRDHQGPAPRAAARPAQGRRARCGRSRSAWPR